MLLKDTDLNCVIDKYIDKSNVVISSIGFLSNLFTIVFMMLFISIIYCVTKSGYFMAIVACIGVYKILKLKNSLFKLNQDFNDLVILLDHIKNFELNNQSILYCDEILKIAKGLTMSVEKIYNQS